MRSHPTPTTGRRVLALVVGALLLGALSVALDAATAHAATTVGPQVERRAPARFPYDIPGGYHRGAVIPKGYVLLSRTVRMTRDAGWRTITLTCPAGTHALSPGLNDPSELTLRIDARQYRSEHRRFRIDVRPAPPQSIHGTYASGRPLLVCGARHLR